MSELDEILEAFKPCMLKGEYRVVEVEVRGKDKYIGIFHGWGDDVIEGETNVQYTVAVIEKLDHTIELIYPARVRFIGIISI